MLSLSLYHQNKFDSRLHHHSHLKGFHRRDLGFPGAFVIQVQGSLPLGNGFELQHNLPRGAELSRYRSYFGLAHLGQQDRVSRG